MEKAAAAFGKVPQLNSPYNTINMELMTALRHGFSKLFLKVCVKSYNAFSHWNISSERQRFVVNVLKGRRRADIKRVSCRFQWEHDPKMAKVLRCDDVFWTEVTLNYLSDWWRLRICRTPGFHPRRTSFPRLVCRVLMAPSQESKWTRIIEIT